MSWFHAIILGIIEGLTEFLPVSSTGHLTIAEQLLGYSASSPEITAFTAVIQLGSILAAVIFFRDDIVRIAGGWFRGIADADARTAPDYRMGWYVIIGSIPIAVIGLAAKHLIEGPLRSLWVVVAGLIGWSAVMWIADRRTAVPGRVEQSINLLDAVFVGVLQCFSLIPGVSRSGATISAGLLRGLDRPTATRFSFFMGIPALVAAAGLESVSQASTISATIGWGPVLLGIVVAFLTGYASIAWLLRFVARHTFTAFIIYRLAVAAVLIWLLRAGIVAAG